MSMLDIHSNALDGVTPVYHELLLAFSKGKNIVYGIVEGKDDPKFYHSHIEAQLPRSWSLKLIKGGNKDQVIGCLKMMDPGRFPPNQVCFFIDRDLSEFFDEKLPNSDNLYITDYYSIESFCTSTSTYERYLRETLNLANLTDGEMQPILRMFEENFEIFCNSIAPLMAQILLWRIDGKRASLNNVRLRDLFIFANGRIALRTEFQAIDARLNAISRWTGVSRCAESAIDVEKVKFEGMENGRRFSRGKYLLWCVIESGLTARACICTLVPRLQETPKLNVTVGHSNGLIYLAPLTRCPQSLENFIHKTYLQHIKSIEWRDKNILLRAFFAIWNKLSGGT